MVFEGITLAMKLTEAFEPKTLLYPPIENGENYSLK